MELRKSLCPVSTFYCVLMRIVDSSIFICIPTQDNLLSVLNLKLMQLTLPPQNVSLRYYSSSLRDTFCGGKVNLWRRLVLPKGIGTWSLTSLQQRLVKTGGRLIKHARYYWLLLAESHLTRRMFGSMLRRMEALPPSAG
jgi:hypothetical protein